MQGREPPAEGSIPCLRKTQRRGLEKFTDLKSFQISPEITLLSQTTQIYKVKKTHFYVSLCCVDFSEELDTM